MVKGSDKCWGGFLGFFISCGFFFVDDGGWNIVFISKGSCFIDIL